MAVFLSPIGNGAQYFTTGGLPLNGGFLNTYQAGTTTPQATFTTSAGNVANPVSIPLGTDGRPPAAIWLTGGIAYKFILTDSTGAQVGPPMDNITGIGAELSVSSGASLIGWIQSGVGAVIRWVQDKLRESVSVEDFLPTGYVTDGSVDYSTQVQSALNSIVAGTVTCRVNIYLGSSITVPPNVTLKGPLGSVGGQAHAAENFNAVGKGTIYVNSAATIRVSNAAAVRGFQVINSALRGALPFANATVAQAAVNAFAGVGITCIGSDISLRHLIILGFATGIKSNDGVTNWYRQKFEWIDIDCTNGIDIYKSADVPRIANIHCWDFLTLNLGIGNYALRAGTAFKVDSNFDEGHFTNCFAWGYAIGFDINAIIDVTLLDCGVDSWAANPVNPGQIGVKVRGTVTQVKIIGGAYSALDKGVDMSSSGTLTITGGTQFFGNKAHIFASAGKLRIQGNAFNSSNWSGTTAIQLTSGVTSPPQIIGNNFDTITYAYVLATGAGSNSETATIWGNTFSGGSTDPFIGERMVTDNGGVATKYFSTYASDALGQIFKLRKARGTAAAPVICNNSDVAGNISAELWKGDAWAPIGGLRIQADGAPSAGSAPGMVVISTTASGSIAPADRIAVNNAGALFPLTDNTYSCGAPSFSWSDNYSRKFRPGTGAAIWTSGAGTPEAVVTAPVGSLYTNTSGGAGTTLYVKESGAGNTGWVPK